MWDCLLRVMLRNDEFALTGWLTWLEHVGSIPSHGAYPSCRFDP